MVEADMDVFGNRSLQKVMVAIVIITERML
jgi:hypothetical protein